MVGQGIYDLCVEKSSLLKCDYQMYIILQFSNKMYQTVELDGYVIMNLGSVVVL